MYGKYFERRVQPLFVRTYSRVPNLDSEIYFIESQLKRDASRAKQCVQQAADGLNRTLLKSEQLSQALVSSRVRRQQDSASYMGDMQASQQQALARQQQAWSTYHDEKTALLDSRVRSRQRLEDVLKSNSTKADSRRASVRRWVD